MISNHMLQNQLKLAQTPDKAMGKRERDQTEWYIQRGNSPPTQSIKARYLRSIYYCPIQNRVNGSPDMHVRVSQVVVLASINASKDPKWHATPREVFPNAVIYTSPDSLSITSRSIDHYLFQITNMKALFDAKMKQQFITHFFHPTFDSNSTKVVILYIYIY